MEERGTGLRRVAWLVTFLTVAGGVAQVAWFAAGAEAPPWAAAGYVARQVGAGLFVLAATGLGAVILLKAPPRPELSLVAVCMALLGSPLIDSGAGEALLAAGVSRRVVDAVLSLGFFMAMAATYRISRTFPFPLPARRWSQSGPWLAALAVWGAVSAGVLPLTPRVGMAVTLGVAGLSLVNLLRMYRSADADGRRRVLWLAQGMLAFTVVAALQVALVFLVRTTPLRIPIPGWEYWLRLVALVAGLAFLGVAVLYRGVLDPALAIRSTALYGFAGVAMVFVFTAVEDLTSSWLTERLGLSDNAGSWLAGGVVALLVGSLHERLGRMIRIPRSDPGTDGA
jgi:hypothetical protein